MTVYLLILAYIITFRDSDEGDCYAGEGQRIINVYRDVDDAESIAAKFNPIVWKAAKETIICPTQPANNALLLEFGFTLHDFDNCNTFKLVVKPFQVIL